MGRTVAAAVLLASVCFAQNQTVGLNLQRGLVESQEGRAAAARLEAQWRPRLTELDKEVSDLKAEGAKFDVESKRRRGWHFWRHVMSRKEKEAEAARLASKQKDIERHRDDGQSEFEAQRIRIVNEIGRKMTALAESYAKDHGLTLVYADQAKPGERPQQDITAEIVRLYDQTYPVPCP